MDCPKCNKEMKHPWNPLAVMNRISLFAACSLVIATGTAATEPIGTRLTIGAVAPPLEIEHWLGDDAAVEPFAFEPGRVYVIEFWATWCGSCIRRMPRIAELQAEYADQGVMVVSVTDEDLATTLAFLQRPLAVAEGETPGTYADFTSRYCLAADPDRSTHKAYLVASQLGTLATTILVGKTGLIEWIGDANSLDDPLARVVANSWNREAFVTEFAKTQRRSMTYTELFSKMRSGDLDGVETQLDELASSEDAELSQFAKMVKPKIREQWFFMAATNDLEATIDRLPEALQRQAGDKVARDRLNKSVRTALELGVLDDPDDLRRVAAALEAAAERHEIDDETQCTIVALRVAAEQRVPNEH